MAMRWKQATHDDLDVLVSTRVQVLRAANLLDETADMSRVEESSRAYYEAALGKDHIALLVYDGETIVGTGGVSFYQVMPTYHNPSGRKAYIMNMYTVPDHRRQGIARETLRRLVEICREQGVNYISLEATAAGRPLYENFGFVQATDEMVLR